jgi:hypothetical protein
MTERLRLWTIRTGALVGMATVAWAVAYYFYTGIEP